METLLLAGILESFFFFFLLLLKKNKEQSDKILAGYFLFSAFHIFIYYSEYLNAQNNYEDSWYILLRIPFIFLHGTFIWFYIQSLLRKTFRVLHFLHLIPFLFISILFYFLVYSLPKGIKVLHLTTELYNDTLFYKIFIATFILYYPIYIVWGIRILKNHNNRLLDNYSNTEKVDFRWLKNLLTGVLIQWICIPVFFFLNRFLNFMPFETGNAIIFVFNSLFIFILGFLGIRETNIFKGNEIIIDEPSIVGEENLIIVENSLKGDFEQYIKKAKPYLNSELTITELASGINLPVKLLSKFINETYHQNFFDYINNCRVEEFKKRIETYDFSQFNILSLAFECGFNSKASFNRVFKKITGITPSEYKNQLKS